MVVRVRILMNNDTLPKKIDCVSVFAIGMDCGHFAGGACTDVSFLNDISKLWIHHKSNEKLCGPCIRHNVYGNSTEP